LVPDGSTEAQRRAASRLAEAVDGMVRGHLAAERIGLVRRRPGRPTLAEVWMRSLASADPWLPPSLDPPKVRALADVLDAWVRSATVVGSQVRLCLRVHEPVGAADGFVELLVQDRDEPSLVIPLADVLQGESPFGTNVIEEALDEAVPRGVAVEGDSIVRLLRDRTAWLEDAGIGVLLPSWWAHRSRLGLRARFLCPTFASAGPSRDPHHSTVMLYRVVGGADMPVEQGFGAAAGRLRWRRSWCPRAPL
jgi:SNF2 Helicase protein